MNHKHNILSAVSIFSGGGGLDLGIEAVGFSTLFATDIDKPSCKTLISNKLEAQKQGKPFLQHTYIEEAAIESIEADYILGKIGLQAGELGLLVGGPPCQAFSVSGRRQGTQDPRGQLVFEYLRILTGLRPKAFVFENVTGFKTIEGGKVFEEVTKLLRCPSNDLYYELSIHTLNAADYGVPQSRERVFVIGHRSERRIASFDTIIFDKIPKRTVKDALNRLPVAGSSFPANHKGRKHSQRIKDRYGSLKSGERDPKTRINKLDLNRPSFTIVVGSDNSGGKGHIHPTEAREVTPRESARIQTFPDWWAFNGTRFNDAIRQIGNAVPPILAAIIGNEIRAQFFECGKLPFFSIVQNLSQKHLFSDEELLFLQESQL